MLLTWFLLFCNDEYVAFLKAIDDRISSWFLWIFYKKFCIQSFNLLFYFDFIFASFNSSSISKNIFHLIFPKCIGERVLFLNWLSFLARFQISSVGLYWKISKEFFKFFDWIHYDFGFPLNFILRKLFLFLFILHLIDYYLILIIHLLENVFC